MDQVIDMDKWAVLTAATLNGYPVRYRKIPYQGFTGVVLTDDGVYGISNTSDTQNLLSGLRIFIE